MLVDLGRAGIEVVRLKGGDPFIFGRGGEEALALAEAGVPFEVVPGVSALSAVPASAGIPVTHRGVSAQVTLVCGHSAYGDDLDYAHLAAHAGHARRLHGARGTSTRIAARPDRAGKAATRRRRSSRRGTHPTAARSAGRSTRSRGSPEGLASPALLVVGDVVAVGERLAQPLRTVAAS